MRAQKLFRRLHYWGAAIAGIPVIVILSTGILLQLKKNLAWVQPTERRGSNGPPGVTFEQLLETAGAGRKPIEETDPTLWHDLEMLVEPLTRGDPESAVRWTAKSSRKLAEELAAQGHSVSAGTVAKLLREQGYSLQGTKNHRRHAASRPK